MAKQTRLLSDRILIQPLEPVERSPGGILIPDVAKEKPTKGKVLAVGPGAKRTDGTLEPMEVEAGDLVLYGRYAGQEVKLDEKDYRIVRQSDILMVLA